jgi:Tfp pilus assembly protein PilF
MGTALCNHNRVVAGRRAVAVPLTLAVVAALALLIFASTLGHDFVEWDDDRNFLRNEHYRGLGLAQLRWMFTSALLGHWIPVTWISLGLDYVMWGMSPAGYHLTNIVLHAANAALMFLVSLRLLREAQPMVADASLRLGAAAAALFFALHPLRAESVAWITERRDVLSGFFYLLTILAYLQRQRRWYMASLVFYALGLLSKSMVMTLPLVLIVLDVYPLRRLPPPGRRWLSAEARPVLLEKLPFAVMAVAVGAAAAAIVATTLGFTSAETYPWPARLLVAAYGVAFYAWKTLVPVALSPLYELPSPERLLDPSFVTAVAAGVIVSVVVIIWRRRWPWALAAWLAYGITLAPVSGILHNGPQLVADRYSYLPCLAGAVLFGAATARLADGRLRHVAVAVAALWLAVLGTLTWGQAAVWRDTDSIWRQALAVDPACAFCHRQWGAVLGNRGALEPALVHFEQALALRPDRVTGHGNIGLVLLKAGRPAQAAVHFEKVLAVYPDNADVRSRLGAALMQQGRLHDARVELERAVGTNPRHVDALTNLGLTLVELRAPAEAVVVLDRALAAAPGNILVHFGLARAYRALGRSDAADDHLTIVRKMDPHLAARAR